MKFIVSIITRWCFRSWLTMRVFIAHSIYCQWIWFIHKSFLVVYTYLVKRYVGYNFNVQLSLPLVHNYTNFTYFNSFYISDCYINADEESVMPFQPTNNIVWNFMDCLSACLFDGVNNNHGKSSLYKSYIGAATRAKKLPIYKYGIYYMQWSYHLQDGQWHIAES